MAGLAVSLLSVIIWVLRCPWQKTHTVAVVICVWQANRWGDKALSSCVVSIARLRVERCDFAVL